MKTINQIIAGAQALLNLSYDLKGCFEEYLSDAYKAFPHMLRVIEEQMPTLIRPYAGNRRIPYQYTPFIRSFLAKGYFGIEQTSQLIRRLKGEPNRRLLCGFTKAPGKAAFSRPLRLLSERDILEKTLDKLVSMAHKELVVYQVNRDSTAIPAREQAVKQEKEKTPKAGKAGQKQPENPQRANGHRTADKAGRENIVRQHRHRMRVGGVRKTARGMYHFGKGTNSTLMAATAGFL